jgi:hypothetical protein
MQAKLMLVRSDLFEEWQLSLNSEATRENYTNHLAYFCKFHNVKALDLKDRDVEELKDMVKRYLLQMKKNAKDTAGLGKGIADALNDTDFEDSENDGPLMLTPEQQARGREFTEKLEASAIEDENGQIIIRDMLTLGRFQGWLYQENLTTNDEFKITIDHSVKWLEARRKYEAATGILENESLCWLYSRKQIRKIEANPTDESLYGLVILPEEREEGQGKQAVS